MSPVRRLLALLDPEPEQYVSEATLRHYKHQRALAELEPPDTQPWLEPHEKVKPIRREGS